MSPPTSQRPSGREPISSRSQQPGQQDPTSRDVAGEGGYGGSVAERGIRVEGRYDNLLELAKRWIPIIAYSLFFLTAAAYFAYLTFPYERVRDRLVAEWEKGQKVPPGGARQSLSIGSLEPSWFTGVILKDVNLTSTPQDPNKPSSVLHADEVRVRISVGSLFSANKDITLSAKALGGTIDGSIVHKKAANPTPPKPSDKDKGEKLDRVIHFDLDSISLNEVAPLRDAIGAGISGTLKGTVDLTLGESRIDKANGTITLELTDFGLPGEVDAEAQEACKAPGTPQPCDVKRVHFKVPALKAFFGKDEIALPSIGIGNMPIQITVKNGVARLEKMSAGGKDLEVSLDGLITLREVTAESDVNVGLRFKFNDSYKKKNAAAEGALFALDNEPKLKAGKRADGFYNLRISGLLGASLQVNAAPLGPGGAAPRPLMPMPGVP